MVDGGDERFVPLSYEENKKTLINFLYEYVDFKTDRRGTGFGQERVKLQEYLRSQFRKDLEVIDNGFYPEQAYEYLAKLTEFVSPVELQERYLQEIVDTSNDKNLEEPYKQIMDRFEKGGSLFVKKFGK